MARTAIVPITAPGSSASAGQSVTWVAADAVNGNYFPSSGKDLLLARNTGSDPADVVIHSQADAFNRTGDISATLAAAAQVIFGPFLAIGWRDLVGNISLDGETGIEFAVVVLP